MNPNMSQMGQGSVFAKYMQYFKYFPFASLPIVSFFPAGVTVNWAITALTHLIVTAAI